MFGKRKRGPEPERIVSIASDVRDGILSYSKLRHPNEAILVLKGGSRRGVIRVDGLVVPPFSHSGPTFAGFPHSFLPFDRSYVGMFHSHPSGTAEPSVTDLHNFFGLVSVIVCHPYEEGDIHAWDSRGRGIRVEIDAGGSEEDSGAESSGAESSGAESSGAESSGAERG